MAQRYGSHPALALWHVGNEYGVHTPECFCETSARDFRRWLAERHGDVEALNAAWGTAFWSGRYGSFEEVDPPRRAPYVHNPGHVLDWRRFCSDALLACFAAERDVLRRVTPDVPVTTNFFGVRPELDLWAWAAEEDVVANDAYPDPADPAHRSSSGRTPKKLVVIGTSGVARRSTSRSAAKQASSASEQKRRQSSTWAGLCTYGARRGGSTSSKDP
jgi:beta-galactosidase GanA